MRALPCSPCPYPPSAVHSLPSCFSHAARSGRLRAPWRWLILILLFQFCHIPTSSTIITVGVLAGSVTYVGEPVRLHVLLGSYRICSRVGESHSGCHGCYAIHLHTAFILFGPYPGGYI